VAGSLLFIAIPLLLGLLCDLVVIVPLRVPLDRHPVISLTTVSLMHHKFLCTKLIRKTDLRIFNFVCLINKSTMCLKVSDLFVFP